MDIQLESLTKEVRGQVRITAALLYVVHGNPSACSVSGVVEGATAKTGSR